MEPVFADISAARERIRPSAINTPVVSSQRLNTMLGADVYFKCENLQTTGSFKIRGAANALMSLSAEEKRNGVVAFSSGNHGQAIAYVSSSLGIPALIVIPEDAPQNKIQRTQEFGASVRLYNRATENREEIARSLKEEHRMTLIPPYNDYRIIAGQGTLVAELFEQVGPVDILLACVGGGGLISGCSLAARHLMPDCQIYGVEPATCNDAQMSLRSGKLVSLANPSSIADGARTESLGSLTFPIIQRLLSDIITVTDQQISSTMTVLAEELHVLAEPTGCLAAAAVLHRAIDVTGKRVGIVITGGNVTMERFAAISELARQS